jgi:hypothetical protein
MAGSGAGGYSGEWLKDWPWEQVERLNADICKQGNAQHGRTSDGHATTKAKWQRARAKERLAFAEVLTLCRACHRQAPFLNYNGNTFVALVRSMCARLPIGAAEAAGVRQLAGHMVAGVLPVEEETRFLQALQNEASLPSAVVGWSKPGSRKRTF